MRTPRGRKIVLILALVLAIILEVITANIFNMHNWCIAIFLTIIYFAIFVFIIIDAHYMIQDNSPYYTCSLVRDIIILLMVICFIYAISNITKISGILTFIASIILGIQAYGYWKLADEYNPHSNDEEDF